MKATTAVLLVLLAAPGCESVKGPVSGNVYYKTLFGLGSPSWSYYQECREAYVRIHPDLSDEVRGAILEGRVLPGMSKMEVRASLGDFYREELRGELFWVYRFWHPCWVQFDSQDLVVASGPGTSP